MYMCVCILATHMRASGMTAGIYLTLGNLLKAQLIYNYLPFIIRKTPTTSDYASLIK